MTDLVIDASAILAMMSDEPGRDEVERALETAVISTANLSEVVTGLINKGIAAEEARRACEGLVIDTAPLDRDLALVAGTLREATRAFGLSLGDRCCLALAIQRDLPALTADRQWAKVDVGVEIRLIR